MEANERPPRAARADSSVVLEEGEPETRSRERHQVGEQTGGPSVSVACSRSVLFLFFCLSEGKEHGRPRC